MLPIFPSPQPDEVLVHIAARYQDLRFLPSLHAPIEHFFGTPAPKLSFEFPVGLDTLAAVTREDHFTADYFITQHTMLPLYKPFLPPERTAKIIAAMRQRPASSTTMIANTLSCRITRPTHYRYCPIHAAEEIDRLGYPYFHRLHQVPGVIVCPVHKCRLETSKVPTSIGRRLVSAYPHVQTNAIEMLPDDVVSSDLIALARDAEWLLNNGMDIPSASHEMRQRYIDLLTEHGLASATGHVFSNRLVAAFKERFQDEFLDLFDSKIDPQNKRGWLARIVQARDVQHPVRHLLLLRFFDMPAEEIFGHKQQKLYFGSGPWECRNRICPCFNEPVIIDYQQGVTRSTKRRQMGLFRCLHCGYSYSLATPIASGVEKVQPSPKVIQYGKVWDTRLQELWFDRTVALKDICVELGVGIDTIHRQAARLNLPENRTIPRKVLTSTVVELDLDATRIMWLNLRQQHPTYSLAQMRSAAPETYNILLRFDAQWLQQHKPPRKQNPQRNVDWASRDNWLCENARIIVNRLRDKEGKPVQITFNSIAKEIGWGEGSIQRDQQKLPRAFTLIKALVESHEDFAIRRIHYILVQSRQDGLQLTRSQLIKLAGLNPVVKTERVMRELDLAREKFIDAPILSGDP